MWFHLFDYLFDLGAHDLGVDFLLVLVCGVGLWFYLFRLFGLWFGFCCNCCVVGVTG